MWFALFDRVWSLRFFDRVWSLRFILNLALLPRVWSFKFLLALLESDIQAFACHRVKVTHKHWFLLQTLKYVEEAIYITCRALLGLPKTVSILVLIAVKIHIRPLALFRL